MKTFLKCLLGLVIGVGAGFLVAAFIIVLFKGGSFREFFDAFRSVKVLEMLGAIVVAIVSFLIAQAVLIIVHEAGHLVGGLLSGYRFVSFRIFSYTFVKENGHLRVKKFKVQGTGGQCLLEPPLRPLDEIPVKLYIAGGVLANILVLLAVLPLAWLRMPPYLHEALWVFIFTDLFLIILNGIPMRIGGICNDAMDFIELHKYPLSKLGVLNQLRANRLIQEGVRPKDLPPDLYEVPGQIDYSKALQVSLPLMKYGCLLDQGDAVAALEGYQDIYSHKDVIMPLYVREICCELVYLYLLAGRDEDARTLLDKPLKDYIESQRGVASSKERLTCAIVYFLEKDRDRAVEIYNRLEASADGYLLRGEVRSDLALMRTFLFAEA